MDQQQLHRLTDRQYSEVEGLFQAMDMPSSDHEEIDFEPRRLSRYNVKSLYEGRQRCYTMPHVSPPAPPSTPTLLTTNGGNGNSPNANLVADNQINHFIYVKNGKNLLRESRCIDSELSKLLNVVSITGRLSTGNGVKNRSQKQLAERGIISASRTISKLRGATKIFKIHRDPKEFLRETDEDSVSAPEYDEDENDTRFRFFRRRRNLPTRMERKFARFEHHERMETIVDSFGAIMSFNDKDT